MSETNTYNLSKPLLVIDRMVTSVTVREPIGADLRKAGDPSNAMAYSQRLSEILAGLPAGTLDTAPARDVIGIASMVSGFLGTSVPGTSSTDTSNAPDGGAAPAGPLN